MIIRNCSFYLNGKKMGTANTGTLTLDSGDEQQIGDGAVIGASQGVIKATIDVTSVEPVAGARDGLIRAFMEKQELQVSAGIIDGRIFKCTMKPFNVSWDTDMARGSLTRKATFQNVEEPQFVG
jgi:hypothetical protein